jgi:hypothetical protein
LIGSKFIKCYRKSCILYKFEEYKFLENKTAKDTIDLFTKYNVFSYIIKHYNVLHTMGGRAITDDIINLMER